MYQPKNILLFILFVPLFEFLFGLVYAPTYGIPIEEYGLWLANSGFCQTILFCIVLGVMLLSRGLLYLVTHRVSNFSEINYLVWAIAEVVASDLFMTLFLALYFEEGYLDILPRVLLLGTLQLLLPYTILELYVRSKLKDERIREDRDNIAVLLSKRISTRREEDTTMVQFYDEKGQMKLAVARNRLISIEAAGNYVTILYDADGRQVRYALRNTLKGVESVCDCYGIERCHRSYFLNLDRVRTLRREGDTMMAEIDFPGIEPIPISKSYVGEVMRKISVGVEENNKK